MKFAVIGLGRFGSRLAASLTASGQEVVGIDRDPSIVEDMRDRVTLAIAMDATDEDALRERGIHTMDVVVVGIGNDFEAVTLATVTLKQLGVPRVIARATNPTIARVLARIGADEVVNPEDEAADRWAQRLINPQFLNQIEFHKGHSIVEVLAPRSWVGRSLAELDLRAKTGLHVVAIKRPQDPRYPDGPMRVEMPGPGEPLIAGDVLVLMGKDTDLARLPREE